MYLDIIKFNSCRVDLKIKSQEFVSAYCLMGREAELQRLVTWAFNKHLAKPRQAYQNRLTETQMTLTRIRWSSPQIWALARFSFCVLDWVFPSPRYKSRGSAGIYKRNRLTIQ